MATIILFDDSLRQPYTPGGTLKSEVRDEKGEWGFFIHHIGSKRSGLGTNLFRETMDEYFAKKFKGTISLTASYASHLFHLYMGMMPKERPLNALSLFPGAKELIPKIPTIQKALKKRKKCDPEDLTLIKKMISFAKTGELETSKITKKDILSCKDTLHSLLEKNISYITYDFIPKLLNCLEKQPGIRKPSTSGLCNEPMIMSPEGFTRWQDAITQKKPFIKFNRLQHLDHLMTPSQKNRLDRIMSLREQAII